MPRIRLERLAVHCFGLGLFGFDHLQLVYEPMTVANLLQDAWFVIEGVRDPAPGGPTLGVQGADGRLDLAHANAATGPRLTAAIGTPRDRRSTEVATGPHVTGLWHRMASRAQQIERQRFPYIAYASPGSAYPSLNSFSVIATLLHDAGIDAKASLPSDVRFTPGIETLLGTSGDDTLATSPGGFTSILGGGGNDRLSATAPASKLYGGSGDDVCIWSRFVGVCHGGQPLLPSAADGIDIATFAQQGAAKLDGPAAVGDRHADFTVTVADAHTRFYSVEQLRWSDGSDVINVADAMLDRTALLHVDMGGETPGESGDSLDLAAVRSGLVIAAGESGVAVARSNGPTAILAKSVERLRTSPHADFIHSSVGHVTIDTGGGGDVVVLEAAIAARTIQVGSGANTIIADLTRPAPTWAAAPTAIVGGGAGDRLLLLLPPAACEPESARLVQLQSGATSLPAGLTLKASRSNDALDIVVRDTASSLVRANVRLVTYSRGDWGINPDVESHFSAALAHEHINVVATSEACSQSVQRHSLRLAGILAAAVQKISCRIIVERREVDAAHLQINMAAVGRHVDTDRRRRPTGHGSQHVDRQRRTNLHDASWLNAHRRQRHRFRNDRVGRRQRGPFDRRVGAVRPRLRVRWLDLATRSGGTVGLERTPAGRDGGTRVLGPPPRSLGASLGPRVRRGPRPARLGARDHAQPGSRPCLRAAGQRRLPLRTVGA